ALSPTMEKGNLAKWLKKEGDKVKAGDVIAEIETDKATMEYESIDDGVLAKIVVPEGAPDVPVNQLIAVLAAEGEDPKAAVAAAEKSAAPGAKPIPSTTRSSSPAQEAAPTPSRAAIASPDIKPVAAPAPKRGDGEAVAPAGRNRVFASPLAR